MDHQQICDVIKDRFKVINKLSYSISRKSNINDIADLWLEIKKLRAFLRLINANRAEITSSIPVHLKTLYGYTGIIWSLQMHRHNLFKYFENCKLETPKGYLKMIENEKRFWESKIGDLITKKDLKNDQDEILRDLPNQFDKDAQKDIIKRQMNVLQEEMKEAKDENWIHIARKTIRDILYSKSYLNEDMSSSIFTMQNAEQLILQLENFRDKDIQIKLLSDSYLNRIEDPSERNNTLEMRRVLLDQKQTIIKQLKQALPECLNHCKQ